MGDVDPYYRNEIFACPSNLHPARPGGYSDANISYTHNGVMWWGPPRPVKRLMFPTPAQTFLTIDLSMGNPSEHNPLSSDTNYGRTACDDGKRGNIGFIHNGYANLNFIDGHAGSQLTMIPDSAAEPELWGANHTP